MPNWTTNYLTARKGLIKKITTNGEIDFNTILPMPESLNLESGSNTDLSIAYYLTEKLTKNPEEVKLSDYVKNTFSKDWANELIERLKEIKDEDKLRMFYATGKQYVDNIKTYGHSTWYTWCIENWGTKWNACETYMDNYDEYSDNEVIEVSFNTAWDFPYGFISALFKKYPKEEIKLAFRYEDDYDTIHHLHNENGQMIEDEDSYEMDNEDLVL